MLDLSYAAEYIGLRCISFKCSVDDIITKVPLPAILHWQHNHFVVVYKTNVNRDSIFISDPAKGVYSHNTYTVLKLLTHLDQPKFVNDMTLLQVFFLNNFFLIRSPNGLMFNWL
ncbi:hypothetical protein GCM10027566_21950 [Arachidicoccus ginsenosidivorans]